MKIYHFDKNISRNLEIIIKDHFKNHLIFNKSNLTDIKSEIDNYHYRIWNRSKKNINNYEYIYTSSDLSKNICNIIPISRSFFKLYDISFSVRFGTVMTTSMFLDSLLFKTIDSENIQRRIIIKFFKK